MPDEPGFFERRVTCSDVGSRSDLGPDRDANAVK